MPASGAHIVGANAVWLNDNGGMRIAFPPYLQHARLLMYGT